MYGMFTYIYYKTINQNVGKYTSPMDPMGYQRFLSPCTSSLGPKNALGKGLATFDSCWKVIMAI